MKKKVETIAIRVTPELKGKLKKLADKDRRSLSDFIHLELEKIVKERG